MAADVTIIGAGLAGLTCARELVGRGLLIDLIEASDRIGGRVRTDSYQGFLLDRGFQVLLTAYPECQKRLDYGALDLKAFYPGSMVWFEGKMHKMADPWRRPGDAMASLTSPVGSFIDKMRVGGLRESVRQGSVEGLFAKTETTTLETLRSRNFSSAIVERMFRPFFGGIFLERELQTSSRMFEFVFRMFSEGDAAIPAAGMEAISKQMGWGVPVRLNTRVEDLNSLSSKAVVIATEGTEAAKLLGTEAPKIWRRVKCFYFAADRAPLNEPIIVLDGEGSGPVNNFCVESAVAPSYAPSGAALLSAAVLGEATEEQVRAQLTRWFGAQVRRWMHLRTYDIPYAQPDQTHVPIHKGPLRIRKGLYVCGDHVENASINGAMLSGKRAADAVIGEL